MSIWISWSVVGKNLCVFGSFFSCVCVSVWFMCVRACVCGLQSSKLSYGVSLMHNPLVLVIMPRESKDDKFKRSHTKKKNGFGGMW